MDHKLGRIGLINWQSRRNRRITTGASLWTFILVACALLGMVALTAQALGWLHLSGHLAWAPAGLLLVAISGQLLAVTRAVLLWFAG